MTDAATGPQRRTPGQTEFVALMAMLTAITAFSIDSMLPALPAIAAELTPDDPNRAQLVVTSFVFGLGLGTLFSGPLSDAFGRKPVMLGGAILYALASVVAWAAPTLETVLAARLVMGMGAAGPRIATLAMVRDTYGGRDMARIMSFVMIIFTLVPALAPSLGAVIIAGVGWRGLFLAFIAFVGIAMVWLWLRQPESLAPANRRPVRVRAMREAVVEMFTHPTTRLSIYVQTLCFGMLFAVLSSTQQVFDQTFGLGDSFPLWFGGIALLASSASMLNARLVGRLGMRALVKGMLTAQIGLSVVMIAVTVLNVPTAVLFWVYVVWTVSLFFQAGLTIGNLNALAMEPMGHIAGIAASVISAVATMGAVVIAIPIGLSFNGTPLPMAIGILICAIGALWLTAQIKRPGEF